MADDGLGRSALAARRLAAVEPVITAETPRYRIGLAADRQVEPIGDAIVADRAAFQRFDQLLDLSCYRHTPGHRLAIVIVTARRKSQYLIEAR